MIRNKSISFKLTVYVSCGCACLLLVLLGLNYHVSRQAMMAHIRENAENLAFRVVNRIEIVLTAVEKIPGALEFFMEKEDTGIDRMSGLIRTMVEANPEIYGAGIAFEKFAFDGRSPYFAPYWAKEKDGLKFYSLGGEEYDYFTMDWFQIPRELNKAVWTEPYDDDVLMTTYSVPFYRSGKFTGVIQVDIDLSWLTDIVSSVKVLRSGDAFLISRTGRIVTHPSTGLIMNETIFSVAESRNDPGLRELGRRMIGGETGFVPFVSIARNKKCWLYYAPVASTGWSLGVVFPEDELFADIRKNLLVAAGLSVSGVIALWILIMWLSRSVTRPLSFMAQAAGRIGAGDFDVDLPHSAGEKGDEVSVLGDAFKNMQKSLKEYIRRLSEATAARQRIESELQIAREIQTGMLPRVFPPFPDRREFSIFATMEPAKEVGGDFYDFCLIEGRKLFFVMGDVSGKGVPAALFMMITKTLLKNQALQDLAPGQILGRVNNILALDNTSAMFATVFCGVLDTESGLVKYANAGHNPPLIRKHGENFCFLDVPKGFVLGPMAGFEFTEGQIQLEPGEALFLYTDGVTEAMDPGKNLFSPERLKQALAEMGDMDLPDMVCGLRKEVARFAGSEPQSDDITMLACRFNGAPELVARGS